MEIPQNANGNWPGLAEDVQLILRSLAWHGLLDQRADGLVCAGCIGNSASGALAWMIPMSFNKDATWRVRDTFDWYSPWYQSKHTCEEVRWFENCGLEDLRVIELPIAVQGRRPLVGELLPAWEAWEVQPCAE